MSQDHSTTLFGISNCDSVKKARKWLADNGCEYRFHDFRKDGLDSGTVLEWLALDPPKSLLNTRSTSWKQLSDQERAAIDKLIAEVDSLGALDDKARQALAKQLVANPTLIKRPVLLSDRTTLSIGFSASDYSALF